MYPGYFSSMAWIITAAILEERERERERERDGERKRDRDVDLPMLNWRGDHLLLTTFYSSLFIFCLVCFNFNISYVMMLFCHERLVPYPSSHLLPSSKSLLLHTFTTSAKTKTTAATGVNEHGYDHKGNGLGHKCVDEYWFLFIFVG